MPIKLIQINLNRSRLAQDIMTHNVSVLGADVVVISEPYRQLAGWFNDATGDASVWVTGFNKRYPTSAPNLSAEGVAVAILGDVAIVSCY